VQVETGDLRMINGRLAKTAVKTAAVYWEASAARLMLLAIITNIHASSRHQGFDRKPLYLCLSVFICG